MSNAIGPSIITNGLIFNCDMGHTRRSWKGRPTTNILNPDFSAWGNNAVTVTNNATLSPNLTIDGALLYVTATGGSRSVSSGSVTAGGCFSVNLKAASITSCSIGIYTGSAWGGSGNGAVLSGPGSLSGSGTLYTISGLSYSDWTRLYVQSALSGTCYLYPGGTGNTTGYSCYAYEPQAEDFSFPSSFVNGTRSNTQAILDLTGNNTLTASSLTYNSDGTFSFNGSSDMIIFPNNTAFDTQTPTVEVWVKPTTTGQNGFWFEKGTVNSQYALFLEGGSITWRNYTTSLTSLTATAATYLSTSNYNQVVGTYVSGTGRRIYVNGVQVASDSQTGTIATNNGGQSIGVYGGYSGGRGYYYNGSIAITRVYNQALTAAQVMQNYAATRQRFGI